MDATEAAIRLAAEHGVSLADVTGSGADGRVTKDDVDAYLEARAAEEERTALAAAPPAVHGEEPDEEPEPKPVSPSGHPYRPKTWSG